MQRFLGMGVVLAGVGAAFLVLTTAMWQNPSIQVAIGMAGVAIGGVLMVLGARQREEAACGHCGTLEDWGFAFCQHCGIQKA